MWRWIGLALALVVSLVLLAVRRGSRPAEYQRSSARDEVEVGLESDGLHPSEPSSPEREEVPSVDPEPSTQAPLPSGSPAPELPRGVILGRVLPPDPIPVLEARGDLWRLVQTKIQWEVDERLATPKQRATSGWNSSTRLNRDGSFLLEDVIAGVPLRLEIENPFGPPCSVVVEPLYGGEVRRLEIELPRGTMITGIVLDQDGLPVPDARVRAQAPRRSVRQVDDEDILKEPVTYTGTDGRFRLHNVKRAERSLSIDGPFQRVPELAVDTTSGDVLDLVIRVDRGVELELFVLWPDRTPVESFGLELLRASPPNQRGKNGRHVVRGLEPGSTLNLKIVAERDGTLGSAVRNVPVPSPPLEIVIGEGGTSDVTVRLIDRDGNPREGSVSIVGPLGDAPAYLTATELESAYVFYDLAAGEWQVSASPFGSQEIESRITLEGDPVEVTLVVPEAARVSGTVRDADGKPIESAWVGDEDDAFTAQFFEHENQKTDAAGRFSIVPQALDGRIVAIANGHAGSEALQLALMPGEHLRGVELQLLPACRLTGIVLDAAGEPVVGAWIQATTPGRPTFSEQSDSIGAFEMGELPSGTFHVSAIHPQYRENRMACQAIADLRADAAGQVEFRFRRSDPVRVHGRIVIPESLHGATLGLSTRGFAQNFELDDEGRFDGLLPSPGRWRGSLYWPDVVFGSSLAWRIEFEVPEVEEHEVVVELAPHQRLELREFLRWIAAE